MKKQVIYLMLFFVMVLWTSGIMVAKTIGDSMGALEFSFWRWAVAVIFMAPFAIPRVFTRMGEIRSKLREVFLLGTFMAGGSTFLIWSVQMTTVFNASLFSATQPILTATLIFLLFSRALGRVQYLGIILGFFGSLIIISNLDMSLIMRMSFNQGDLLVILAVLFYSLYAIYVNRWLSDFSALSIMFLSSVSTTLILSLIVFAFNDMSFNIHNSGLVGKIVYMAIFPTIIATTMWNAGIKALGPNKSSAFINLMPVLGILVSVKFFKDPVQIHHILGMILTCTGVMFVLKGGKLDKDV
tara:strand:+ start:14097 stop:14990 length:894 start_codon:yes stop_codon:yes gene_type:complete